ncbi:MAG: Rad52/22 double-strand break repair protein [Gemmatimonadetes bacterium]|nr:Rad52/22 double-strand break repair protein [Gemmatimonadota bacterium]
MIARHEPALERADLWARLAAPVNTDTISWRQDGRVIQRDGRFYSRFVCYIEANTVRERLDSVVPGEWDLTLDLLPPSPGVADAEQAVSFKARLQVLGVTREDVGTGKDYKQAATDAFKRAGVRFGIGHELYAYEQNWVPMDGDGKYAKPLEDPADAYARRTGTAVRGESRDESRGELPSADATQSLAAADEPSCPECGGRMWDNRATKRNPRAPDFKCRQRSCDGVVWPSKGATTASAAGPTPAEEMDAALAGEIPF